MCEKSEIRANSVTVSKYSVPGPEQVAFNGALEALCEHRGQPLVAMRVLDEIVCAYNAVKEAEHQLNEVRNTLLPRELRKKQGEAKS